MKIKGHSFRRHLPGWWAVAAGLLAAILPASGRAQEVPPTLFPSTGVVHADATFPSGGAHDSQVVPAACSSCGGGLFGSSLPAPVLGDGPIGGCGCDGGCGGPCYPGHPPCDCDCEATTCVGRFFCGVYHCICCPDPCYEPAWVPLANASLFVDPARPATQVRLRGDFGSQLQFPDKAEWFFAQENKKGPQFAGPPLLSGKPGGSPNVDYTDGLMYMEGAVDKFSLFVEVSYRNVEPTFFPGASGFGDMNVGTKSLLLDCELLQLTFQFKAYLPTGNFTKGIGTGHTSLEPSLIAAVKLTPTTYFQAQTAFWFPLGGTQAFEGPVFHYHLSLNQLLCHCGHGIQLIGMLELSGYELEGGAFTAQDGTIHSAKEVSDIVEVGPGLRLDICNKVDFGGAAILPITKNRMSEVEARAELRWRF